MNNYGDLGGCYPPRPTASMDNTLLNLHNCSQDTQPHSLLNNLELADFFSAPAPPPSHSPRPPSDNLPNHFDTHTYE